MHCNLVIIIHIDLSMDTLNAAGINLNPIVKNTRDSGLGRDQAQALSAEGKEPFNKEEIFGSTLPPSSILLFYSHC